MAQSNRSLVVFGTLDARAERVARESAAALGVQVNAIASPTALDALQDAHPPLAVVLARGGDGAEEACTVVRGRPAFANVPILAMTEERGETAFLDAYQHGYDDLVSPDGPGLARRLHLLANRPASADSAPRSVAVVASSDLRWRSLAARGLRNAGVDAIVVGNASDAIEASRRAKLVVAADDLEPDGGVTAAARARAEGVGVPWVIVAPPKRLHVARTAAALVPTCAVIDACAPPENAVFIANELANAPARDLRATTRLLFATTVSFRAAGRDHDEIGFTYNVSAGGMYVRTLAPLAPGDEIWLELNPPRCDRRVRLAGRVAWRRVFGPSGAASVPPGFGVQISEGLASDLARYRAGCEALADAVARTPSMPPRWRKSIVPSQIAPAIV